MSDDSLSRAFELTVEIEAAAAEGDWVRAASLVEDRSPLLMGLSASQTPESLARIRAIQSIDATVERQAKSGQEMLLSQRQDSIKRIKAAGFYQMTGKL